MALLKIVVLDGHALNPGDLSWDAETRVRGPMLIQRSFTELRLNSGARHACANPESFRRPRKLRTRRDSQAGVRPRTVLVRLLATSVNAIDIKIRTGLPIGPDRPAVLGADVAGNVEEVGAGVLDFRPGDEVYGCDGGVKGRGGRW